MAERGDILVARRRLGFAAAGRLELFVVVQSNLVNGIETSIVAPLDDDAPLYKGDPLVVRVSAKETGARNAQVVLVHLLTVARLEKFEPIASGRLSARSMAQVDRVLHTVLFS